MSPPPGSVPQVEQPALTPAQQRVVDELLTLGEPRPSFEAGLHRDLRRRLEDGLAPLVDGLAEPLWVSKHALAQVQGCEAHYLAEQGWQGWSLATCEGEITHRAIQISVASGDGVPPLELVDYAIGDIDPAASLGRFLDALSPPARAKLRGRSANAVSTFLECWPPLRAAWWPRCELPVRAELCGGRVILSGRVDLCLGRAVGSEARCLFVDLKTGGHYPAHLDDLRFYALVQTLRIGVPPFRVASYYLDSAGFAAEDVTAATLETALRRTVGGVRTMGELASGDRAPEVTPNPRCSYCRIRTDCDGARRWEERAGL